MLAFFLSGRGHHRGLANQEGLPLGPFLQELPLNPLSMLKCSIVSGKHPPQATLSTVVGPALLHLPAILVADADVLFGFALAVTHLATQG